MSQVNRLSVVSKEVHMSKTLDHACRKGVLEDAVTRILDNFTRRKNVVYVVARLRSARSSLSNHVKACYRFLYDQNERRGMETQFVPAIYLMMDN